MQQSAALLAHGNDVAPAFGEPGELAALGIGEGGDGGKDEGAVGTGVLGVEREIVDHVEGKAGFDEGLVETEGVVFHLGAGTLAAVEGGSLLGIDDGDASERSLRR